MIDLSPEKNPARLDAIHYATIRSKREGVACCVYVGPPRSDTVTILSPRTKSFYGFTQWLEPSECNVWYVRRDDEPAPEGAELYVTLRPENL